MGRFLGIRLLQRVSLKKEGFLNMRSPLVASGNKNNYPYFIKIELNNLSILRF